MSERGYLDSAGFCQSVIAVLVNRLGGSVSISQDDFDAVRAANLRETQIEKEDGSQHLHLETTRSTRIN